MTAGSGPRIAGAAARSSDSSSPMCQGPSYLINLKPGAFASPPPPPLTRVSLSRARFLGFGTFAARRLRVRATRVARVPRARGRRFFWWVWEIAGGIAADSAAICGAARAGVRGRRRIPMSARTRTRSPERGFRRARARGVVEKQNRRQHSEFAGSPTELRKGDAKCNMFRQMDADARFRVPVSIAETRRARRPRGVRSRNARRAHRPRAPRARRGDAAATRGGAAPTNRAQRTPCIARQSQNHAMGRLI